MKLFDVQENGFIEELAELISVNFEDMTAMNNKPDKCAILQQTVNQIRKIREQGGDGRLSCDGDGVQQGEVSSSKPALLDTQMLGTFLLEALDGFLFVVNTEGKIEYVSDNVTHFLRYNPEDLVGQEIYNIIHLGDHDRFSSVLLPSLGQLVSFNRLRDEDPAGAAIPATPLEQVGGAGRVATRLLSNSLSVP